MSVPGGVYEAVSRKGVWRSTRGSQA